MPLTDCQKKIAKALAENRSEDSYLAGGAAIHLSPNSQRLSNDLDYFHDSEERVAKAFAQDRPTLEAMGCLLKVLLTQPGYIRAEVQLEGETTKIEWAHDSAWRFMPTVMDPECGYRLHPVDLAINKVLALTGRDEPRDLLDTLYVHREVLPLGALCWAVPGKDPGFSPHSLLELLQRRGRIRQEDLDRLRLVEQIDPAEVKRQWLLALESAKELAVKLPPDEVGCLYYSPSHKTFVVPLSGDDSVSHFGSPGGVLPRIL